MNEAMTRRDRDDLTRLTKQRERLAKSGAKQRSAELLANFEEQVAAIYHLDDDAVWQEAHAVAMSAVAEANEIVRARSRELGIPDRFAPHIGSDWFSRGENAAKARVVELRKVAQTRIAAAEKAACTAIERRSLEIQTELLAGGLQTDDARAFLESLPTPEALMPPLSVPELEAVTTAVRSSYR